MDTAFIIIPTTAILITELNCWIKNNHCIEKAKKMTRRNELIALIVRSQIEEVTCW